MLTAVIAKSLKASKEIRLLPQSREETVVAWSRAVKLGLVKSFQILNIF